VVDEISMLPKEMWELLLSHDIHVIALGDPGQLPPIGEPNGVLDKPHIFLDEIMRQAQESEIIRLTMDIRAGKPLELYKGNEVQIVSPGDLVTGMYTWADQVIVATNTTRRRVNNIMREMIHNVDSTEPIVGDKVICLRNYWDTINEAGDCLVNGSIGYIKELKVEPSFHPYMNYNLSANFLTENYTDLDVESSLLDPMFYNLNMDYKLLTEGEPTVNKDNFRKFPPALRPLEYDYGYAITCWKSQGSEYDKVLLFEEGFPFSREDHIKYLYTGATRAAEKLVIIKKA
jgi:exodeoxyribonuclease-5